MVAVAAVAGLSTAVAASTAQCVGQGQNKANPEGLCVLQVPRRYQLAQGENQSEFDKGNSCNTSGWHSAEQWAVTHEARLHKAACLQGKSQPLNLSCARMRGTSSARPVWHQSTRLAYVPKSRSALDPHAAPHKSLLRVLRRARDADGPVRAQRQPRLANDQRHLRQPRPVPERAGGRIQRCALLRLPRQRRRRPLQQLCAPAAAAAGAAQDDDFVDLDLRAGAVRGGRLAGKAQEATESGRATGKQGVRQGNFFSPLSHSFHASAGLCETVGDQAPAARTRLQQARSAQVHNRAAAHAWPAKDRPHATSTE